MTTSDELTKAKAGLRREAAARRAAAYAADTDAATVLAARLVEIGIAAGARVSAYWPIRDEIDPRPALQHFHRAGHVCCLPVVVGPGEALRFRAWRPGDELEPAPFDTRVPRAEAAEVVPAVLLVPLLAFDARGYRLGYGGGFYDRTIAGLRAANPATLALGVGFAAQEVEAVPRDAHDARLDWIVTEREARRIE
jgi:5-formyltetrahydrofolate cyclo-ligase